jgi:hypothetical protein
MMQPAQEEKPKNSERKPSHLLFFGWRRKGRSVQLPEKTNPFVEFLGILWFLLIVGAIGVLIRICMVRILR